MAKMSQEELAELQNPENWEWEDVPEPIAPVAKAPRAIVSVAFSRADFERIARYARDHGLKTSEFIRQATIKDASRKSATSSRNTILVEESSLEAPDPPNAPPILKRLRFSRRR